MTIAILGLLSALVPLIVWVLKRRWSPTHEERRDESDHAVSDIEREIILARRAGNDALADALLRRLRDRQAAVGGVSVVRASRELGAGDSAGGHPDNDDRQ